MLIDQRHSDSSATLVPASSPSSPNNDVPLLSVTFLETSSPDKSISKVSLIPQLANQEDRGLSEVIVFEEGDKSLAYRSKTLEILAALFTYCISSIIMTVTNKFVLSNLNFHMNFLLLAIQV
jgi:hypothetical protein